MTDIIWRHCRSLLNLNTANLNFSEGETALMHETVRNIDQTVNQLKSVKSGQEVDTGKFHPTSSVTSAKSSQTSSSSLNGNEFIQTVNRTINDINCEASELKDKLTRQKRLMTTRSCTQRR
jgi:hypothetical protein